MKTFKRTLCLLLSLVLLAGLLPAETLAAAARTPEGKPEEFTTAEGETVAVEDDWEELYPYGVFLFTEGTLNLREGGETGVVRLYRLGGTQGRATAFVSYSPTVMQLDEDRVSYDIAVGCNDVYILVEDALPIAMYQPIGKAPEPERSDAKLLDGPYAGDDAQDGDRVLTLDTAAESWQWYVFDGDDWQIVEDATGSEFVVGAEELEEYDFRCVYTLDGAVLCTDSLKGETYVKEEEYIPPEQPEDLDLAPDQTFSPLEMDPEDPWAGYAFAVTFAEGEWVKEIRVSAPDDNEAEPREFATFTLADHLGADIFDGAATLTLSIEDDEAPEKFTIGFTEAEFEADKASGTAQVILKRTGGNQTAVSVDWSTADGTAVAGRDYQAANGTVLFYAGLDEAVIEVPLIDDRAASDEPLTFTVSLGELKGDGEGLCTLTRTETEVSLTNSGTGSGADNLATMLFDAEMEDVSGSVTVAEIAAPVGGGVVTGEPVEVPEEEILYAEIEGFDDPQPETEGDAALMTYNYGRISFPSSSSSNYWGSSAYIAGGSPNDVTGWSGGSGYGSGWQAKGKSPTWVTLNIPYMSQMYTGFKGTFETDVEFASAWDRAWYGTEFVYGIGYLFKSNGSTYAETVPRATYSDGKAHYYPKYNYSTSWDIGTDVAGVGLALLRYDAHDAEKDTYARITSGTLPRRTLSGGMNLRIHTANDGESGGGNVVTAPQGAAALRERSGVYASMKPTVSVVPHAGGVTGGKLYVGSKLEVSLTNLDSFKPYSGEALSSAVYLTRSDGSIVNGPKIEKNGLTYYITMVWDGMTAADLTDTYTVNVVLTRTQRLLLDLTPSVPRKTDANGEVTSAIDTARVGEARSMFESSASGNGNGKWIVIGTSASSKDAPYFTRQIVEERKDAFLLQMDSGSPALDLSSVENVQYINFNRSERDRIVYNGKVYKGNEKIWLSVEDLALGSLRFSYYNEAFLDADCTMNATVLRTELYFDGDGDGKISGTYNSGTGYFNLSSGTADRFVMMLEQDGSYNEALFQPEKLDNGKYGEYYLKIYYTMTPRNLSAPTDGAQKRAQVLPAFVTSVTDQANYSSLTEEQQSYRYVLPGIGADGARTSDNHPMYGAEASAVQFVDVPLGGDHSPVEHVGDPETGKFVWTPDYHGNLIYPFSNPDPIYIEHSLAGDNIALAKVTVRNRQIETDAAGKADLNGYLGSFVADTTVALCVAEQTKTADQLRADAKSSETLAPESSELIRRSATPDASYLSFMTPPAPTGTNSDPGDSGSDYAEMLPDFGMNLATATFDLLGYAKLVTNKDELALTISLPVISKSNVNGEWKDKQWGPQTVQAGAKKQWGEVQGAYADFKSGNANALKESFKNNGYQALDGGGLSSSKFTASFSLALILKFKYDTVANGWLFKEFAGAGTGALSYKYTYRFSPCPLLFFYVSVNFSVTLTTGGTLVWTERERAVPYIKSDSAMTLKKGADTGITTKYNNIRIEFSGKLLIEVYDSKGGSKTKDANTGFVKSDGGKKSFQLANGKGLKFDSEKYVRITALEDSKITYLNVVEDLESDLVWSGAKVTPSLGVEVGLGFGIDWVKVEGCARIVASADFTYGILKPDGTRENELVVQAAKFVFAITVRAVFFSAKAEIDLVGATISYKHGSGWTIGWSALGEERGSAPLQEDTGGGFLSPLDDTSATQRIYSPRYGEEGADLMAYDSEDASVPFQLSGYNSSVSSFKLADGLTLGDDYQVVTANGQNYVLYTIARPNPAGPMDRTMLVCSRLVSTGGMGSVGLVNPLDDITPPEGVSQPVRNPIPYILVDTVDGGGDDGTGDVEFDVRVDGNTIRAAWVSYDQPGLSPGDNLLRETGGHTVVKTASYDMTRKDGFTVAQTVSEQTGNRALSPAALGENATAWVRAEPMTDAERTTASANYASVLKTMGFDPDGSDLAKAHIGQHRLATQQALWDASGKGSVLCVRKDNSVAELALPERQTVDNIAFTCSDNDYFAAFTTRETAFTDADGNRLTSANGAKNLLTIRRLCLVSFRIDGGGQILWNNDGKSVVLRTLYDYEDNSTLQDGIWSGSRITPYEEPYFANLQFLNAALGDRLSGTDETFALLAADGAEDFLLFEMNGCTYVVRQNNLKSIVAEQRGSIIPFFAVDEDYRGDLETGATSATGRAEVTIGADSEGGLAAVYVETVPGTTNTALCMSKYDPKTGTWGKGVMLAMNHMDVYEDAVAEGWEQEELQSAYLGRLSGYRKGGMDQFTFAKPRVALGVKSESSGQTEAEGGSAAADDANTLLILTQGSMSYLTEVSANGETFITIDEAGKGRYPSGTGLYALSYGMGHQTVGEANLSFFTYDFTAGAELYALLSFTNTGDISIRCSEAQPVTVTLSAGGAGVPDTRLMSWKITENIVPGQQAALEGGFTLPMTLPEGATFNLTVSESDYYVSQGGTPYTATVSGVLTVGKMPELGFEAGASAALAGLSAGALQLDAKGNAILDVDFLAGNRGNADAANVYAQFTYDTGETGADGAPVYAALDISANTMTVGEEEPLASLMASQTGNDFKNGILYIGFLRAGYGRRVRGTVTLSPDKYFTAAGGATLGARVELFSDADANVASDGRGVRTVEHGEYNTNNNVFLENIEAAVTFALPDQILLSKGSLLRLPITYLSSTGSRTPNIQVEEYPDKEDTDGAEQTRFQRMDQNLDQLYYEARDYSAGRGSGTVVVRAAKEGSGYIRVMDQNTNSYRDISFQVTGEKGGMDITPDNGRFTFYNTDGSVWKSGDAKGAQNWNFQTGVKEWGNTVEKFEPYRGTLARAVPGTSFSFETEAESISLHVDGTVEVSSDFPGFETVRDKAIGGDPTWFNSNLYIYFGANPDNKPHKVTVRAVKHGYTSDSFICLDRIVEHYSGDVTGDPAPASDSAPKLYWSASFPKKGSFTQSVLVVELNVVSSIPLANVSFQNVTRVAGRVSQTTRAGNRGRTDNWMVYRLDVVRNGEIVVDAVDKNGNHTIQHVTVDWWPEGYTQLQEDEAFSELTPEELAAQGGRWMTAELVEGDAPAVHVRIDESAPFEDAIVLVGREEDYDGLLSLESETGMEIFQYIYPFQRGEEYDIPFKHDGLNMVIAYCYAPNALTGEPDPEYTYTITDPDGTETTYNALDEYYYNLEFFDVEGAEAPDSVTVTFDANGGTGSMAAQTVPVNTPTALDRNAFSRYGYRFTGWNTAADGSGTDYSDGQTVTLEVGLTLYAQWRSGGSSIPSGGSTPSAPTPTPTPTPAPAEPEAPLTEAEKDALLGEYGDLDKDAWYRDGVAFVLRRGIMNGMADGSFGPNLPASRAMIVTMLWRMEGEPAPSGSIAFEDVQGGAWYAGAVRWAASAGLVNGYSDFLFGPDDNVSREQLAVILYRYAKYKGADVSAGASLSGYADAADVSDWAGDALRWAVSNGIINGVGNNNLSPGAEAVRAQVAAMLMRYDALTKET